MHYFHGVAAILLDSPPPPPFRRNRSVGWSGISSAEAIIATTARQCLQTACYAGGKRTLSGKTTVSAWGNCAKSCAASERAGMAAAAAVVGVPKTTIPTIAPSREMGRAVLEGKQGVAEVGAAGAGANLYPLIPNEPALGNGGGEG